MNVTPTPATTFSGNGITTRLVSDPVQTSLLLKYFIITNESAVATATINLYIEDQTGNLIRIAPTITLQNSATGYHVSLIESEGNIVVYPNQKIHLEVPAGTVSAVFSLTPPPE